MAVDAGFAVRLAERAEGRSLEDVAPPLSSGGI
jgi:hypothetical protein